MSQFHRARFGIVFTALVFTAHGLAGQHVVDAVSVPTAFAQRVAADIAQQWQLPTDQVVLDWGPLPEAFVLHDGAQYDLRSANGTDWLSLVVTPEGFRSVVLRVRAGRRVMAPVAATALQRGAVLTGDDIGYASQVVWGSTEDNDAWQVRPGWTVRRRLSIGDPLDHDVVEAPPLITSGEQIEVVWKRGPVEVRLLGTALNDARQGEYVRVKLASGRGSVRGTAIDVGRVTFDRKR